MRLTKVELTNPLSIVADGAVAQFDVGEGRLIPALILDCDKNRALHDLIVIHEQTPPGDVSATWARRILDKSEIFLALEFEKPVHTKAVIRFDVLKQGVLVDGIISARGVYLQAQDFSPAVSAGLDKPRILVEVAATFPGWNALYHATLVKKYRRSGYSRTEAKQAATEHIARLRDLWHRRMNQKARNTDSASTNS